MREKNIPYDVTYLADAFSSFFALLAELWSPAAVAARTKNAATARDRPDAVDIAKSGQETNEPPAEEKEKAGSSSEVFFWCYGGKHKLPLFRKQPRQRLPLQGRGRRRRRGGKGDSFHLASARRRKRRRRRRSSCGEEGRELSFFPPSFARLSPIVLRSVFVRCYCCSYGRRQGGCDRDSLFLPRFPKGEKLQVVTKWTSWNFFCCFA